VQHAARLSEQEELNHQAIAAAMPTPASQAAAVYALNVAHGRKTYGNKGNVLRAGVHKPHIPHGPPPPVPTALAVELTKPPWHNERTTQQPA
jgi:hypothetical protein